MLDVINGSRRGNRAFLPDSVFALPAPQNQVNKPECFCYLLSMLADTKTIFCVITAVAMAGSTSAMAMDNALRTGLLKLDPQTRLEQRCDAEVLDRISADNHKYKADRVVAYAFATPIMTTDSIRSPGAAFRSKGEWYRLKFKCETAPDHMEVLDFRYKIGKEIPKDEWTKYNLYD